MIDPMSRVIEDIQKELLQIENRLELLSKENPSGMAQVVEEEVTRKLEIVGSRISKLESQRPKPESLKDGYGRHCEAYKTIVDVHLSDVIKSEDDLNKCSAYLRKHLEDNERLEECLLSNKTKIEYAMSVLESHPESLLDAERRLEQINNRLVEKISSTTELFKRIMRLNSDASSYKTKLQSLLETKRADSKG